MQEQTKDEEEFKINIIEINTHKEVDLEKELILIILNMMMDIIMIITMMNTMIINIMINIITRTTNLLKYIILNIIMIKNNHMTNTKITQINHMINKTLMNNSMK